MSLRRWLGTIFIVDRSLFGDELYTFLSQKAKDCIAVKTDSIGKPIRSYGGP